MIGLPSFTRALLAGFTRFRLPRRGRRVGLIGVREKRDIYLFRLLSLSGFSLEGFKTTADTLIALAEEIEDTESL